MRPVREKALIISYLRMLLPLQGVWVFTATITQSVTLAYELLGFQPSY